MGELVVLRVRANPNPCHRSISQAAQSAVVIADADRDTIITTLQAAKVKRGMIWVLAPQTVVLKGQLLNVD
jgi:hypothetical protein